MISWFVGWLIGWINGWLELVPPQCVFWPVLSLLLPPSQQMAAPPGT